ncbi:DUF630 family protein [Zea mays]|uniref:DUF630 family protein n=1 Tax=Zea mays TaxID=4577 RepID=A0A1D6NKS3_MAIZE|nr:DUF630 family protein [Zea mays]
MGCSNSKVDNEEPVRRSKDRRQLMKQLVRRRPELAAVHIAYLHALRNTGATLRQFVELESALSQQPPVDLVVPPSPTPQPPPPPPPELSVTSSLPPSPCPPPPVPFSPVTTIRKMEKRDGELPPPPPPLVLSPIRLRKMEDEFHGGDFTDDDDTDSCSTPLPPPLPPGIDWEDLDPYNVCPLSFPSPFADRNDKEVASHVTMDNDPEVDTEFYGEEDESMLGNNDVIVDRVHVNPAKGRALGDGNSSTVSWVTKDSDSMAVPWRSKKSLVEIVKEIDEYFLKAAASGNDVVIFLDSAGGRPDALEVEAKKGAGKNSKPAKVFSTLSWSWSFKSQQASREASVLNSSASGYGYHGKTLEKLYDEEQKLYKLIKRICKAPV